MSQAFSQTQEREARQPERRCISTTGRVVMLRSSYILNEERPIGPAGTLVPE
jgi:hypothetical protein